MQLEYRNAVRLDGKRIDCEINHPRWGWIPFTAVVDDVEELGRELYVTLSAHLEEIA